MASSTTWHPYSTAPVASMTASTCSDPTTARWSSLTTGVPAAIARSASAAPLTRADVSTPASRYARSALSPWRLTMATSSMPTVELMIWFARPRPMNPAPTSATRTGRPSAARRASALSTMITRGHLS
jgi:hypothetical protein